MLKQENKQVKEIDELILSQLRGNLEISKDSINILHKEEVGRIITQMSKKRDIILELFNGDFTINEQSIKERYIPKNAQKGFYTKMANKFILKRLDQIFKKVIMSEPQNVRLISVCADRYCFIKLVVEEDLQMSFIEECLKVIEQDEIRITNKFV